MSSDNRQLSQRDTDISQKFGVCAEAKLIERRQKEETFFEKWINDEKTMEKNATADDNRILISHARLHSSAAHARLPAFRSNSYKAFRKQQLFN